LTVHSRRATGTAHHGIFALLDASFGWLCVYVCMQPRKKRAASSKSIVAIDYKNHNLFLRQAVCVGKVFIE
jgi:hypothetical protein